MGLRRAVRVDHRRTRSSSDALDLGVNLFDTAEIYGMGRSERIVGEALARPPRARRSSRRRCFPVLPLSPVVQWRAVQSAQRLGVERIDLYQVHWPNPIVPLPATMRGMRALLDVGLVRHVGVSNFPTEWWRRAERSLGAPVLSNQVQYSLACRKPDRDGGAVPYAQAVRPHRHRLQPARAGPARRPLRRRPPATGLGSRQQPAVPAPRTSSGRWA